MVISGKDLAEKKYVELQRRAEELLKRNITPHLAVILIGDDASSLSYIRQKQKAAERIGAKLTLFQFPYSVTTEQVIEKINQYNDDSSVHAVIIQKPFPPQLDKQKIDNAVLPKKDIDGFGDNSTFILALPLAVSKILQEIALLQGNQTSIQVWSKDKRIVILGKGETAGKPIATYFKKIGIAFQVIDSKTQNREELTKNADIIISAVGKGRVITKEQIKSGVILIDVGMHSDENGKLKGDYEDEDIKDEVSFYTPTPGGVGPMNVVYLMDNLISATEQQSQ